MKLKKLYTAAGIAAAALILVSPSYATTQSSRGHNFPRSHAGSPRARSPIRVAPVRPRVITPGFGLGYGMYGSHLSAHSYGYDPFGWQGYGMGFGGPGYGPGYYASPAANLGGVRIKDAPRNAEVYVDDAYAGVVDSFDGRFQRLTLEPGSYRIVVRGGGVDQSVNINVQPGRTTTLRVPPRP